MQGIVDMLQWFIPLLIFVAPIVVKLLQYLGALTHSERISLLAERANIVVEALDRDSSMSNMEKKKKALDSLQNLADEFHIRLSKQQANEYIESAVTNLRVLQNSIGGNNNE